METAAIFERIKGALGGEGLEFTEDAPQPGVIVAPSRLRELCLFLRDDPELRCESLQCLTGTDFPEDERLRTSYHVFSYGKRHLVAFHVDLPRDEPRQPSVHDIWPAANWHERESWDLLGIVYEGHPDLRRILLPDDWEEHPLRKDYEEKSEYRGIPTQREREWLSWQK